MKEDTLKNTPLFAELTDDEQRAIGKRMRLENYKPGETIFIKGRDSEALYLIKEGWVKLSAGDNEPVVANLGPGSLLGETDFFLGQIHTTTARASGNVAVLALASSDLHNLIAERPEIGINLGLAFGAGINHYLPRLTQQLAAAPLLQDLSERERSAVAHYLAPQRYFAHDAIYRSGDRPTGIFFIETGTVRLLGDTDDDYTELNPGAAFGEMAVIADKPHFNTAQAATEVVLWQLSAADFAALAQNYPSIKTKLGSNLRGSLTLSDQNYAITILERIPLFENLPTETLKDVAHLLLLRHVPSGEFVFAQGDPGEAMYIVDNGAIEAIAEASNRPGDLVGRFAPGDFFGEDALLTGKTRSFTAYAAADTNLWGLYRSDFDNLLVKYPQLSLALGRVVRERLEGSGYAIEPHLKKIAQLGGLSRRQLDDLAGRLQARHYQGGSIIYYEGQTNEEMYFVGSGQVECWATTMQGPALLETHEQSDFFGEIALLSGRAHPDTAHVLMDSDIWVLTRSNFEEFVQRYPNLALVFNRLLGQRFDETMNRLRGVFPQRALPPGPGGAAGPSRPVAVPTPPPNPYASRPVRPVMMPPVPVRPVSSTGFQRVLPPGMPNAYPTQAMPPLRSGYTPPPATPSAPAVHAQYTQPVPPVSGPGPAVHAQYTQPISPVKGPGPVQPAQPKPSRGVKPQKSRPVEPNAAPVRPQTESKGVRQPPRPKRKEASAPSRPVAAMPQMDTESRGTKPLPAAEKLAQTGQRLDASRPQPAIKPQPRPNSQPQAAVKFKTGSISRPVSKPMQPRAVSNRKLKRYNTNLSVWFAKRSMLAKIGIVGILLLLTWLCFVSAPWLIIDSLASTFEDNGARPGDRRSIVNQVRQDGAMGAVAVLPFIETATATPTETTTPTTTPTASPTPTETLIPTFTPTPTQTPTPTSTPTPVDTPTPTHTPRPRLTSTPRPPTDTPTPAATATPNVDFRLVSVRQLTPCENKGKHHIFIKVQDPSGQGIDGVPVKISKGVESWDTKTETKTNLTGQLDAGRIDFAMFKGSYEVQVLGGSSEMAKGITPDYAVNEPCGESSVANSLFHLSFEVIFQRTY